MNFSQLHCNNEHSWLKLRSHHYKDNCFPHECKAKPNLKICFCNSFYVSGAYFKIVKHLWGCCFTKIIHSRALKGTRMNYFCETTPHRFLTITAYTIKHARRYIFLLDLSAQTSIHEKKFLINALQKSDLRSCFSQTVFELCSRRLQTEVSSREDRKVRAFFHLFKCVLI